MNRREFVLLSVSGGTLALRPVSSWFFSFESGVALAVDRQHEVVDSEPVAWAIGELESALVERSIAIRYVDRPVDASPDEVCLLISGFDPASVAISAAVRQIDWSSVSGHGDLGSPVGSEGVAIVSGRLSNRDAVVALGSDERGLTYALLDLADNVRERPRDDATLEHAGSLMQQPTNPVRSVMRQFTSEALDQDWFYDRDMWRAYLTMLATHRFNRFHLAFGLGYDSLRRVVDSYLLFLYPFVVSVPGYDVSVSNLSSAEREANLEMLRFIGRETVARGLEFQLGIWTHGYTLPESPEAQYIVQGLTDDTHAPYCRDALTKLLSECPDISAVALRIHGESGIAEGSYAFWSTVFDGVARAGRPIEIDLHAKGIDMRMIDQALATGMPVNVSPKLHAEHMGMPYHQTAIREWEMPEPGQVGSGLMTMSEGQRSFTRYGYADLLQHERRYTVRHRVFAGTQRVLAWGDPVFAAAYSRAYGFCGSTGFDLMEPLTCRGRRGTGEGTRAGYVDAALRTAYDWQKYTAWYRTMGRAGYDPETTSDVFSREFARFGGGALLEAALSLASRILPIVTTAYLPSAACDAYWPEIYWNQPITEPGSPNPYFDTERPTTFQHASAIDPQMFSTCTQCAAELIAGERSGKYTPLEVAEWLEFCASGAMDTLARAGTQASSYGLRVSVDVSMMAGLGRFFADKFRAGVLFALFEETEARLFLDQALDAYRDARTAYAGVAELGGRIYQDDLSASDRISERGQWSDRLAAIDADIDNMASRLSYAIAEVDNRLVARVAHAFEQSLRVSPPCFHRPPDGFRPGSDVSLGLQVDPGFDLSEATLFYRHVNQAERFNSTAMATDGGSFTATIPAAYTDSPYELQYYFEVREGADRAWIVPGFDPDLMNQPYVVLERV